MMKGLAAPGLPGVAVRGRAVILAGITAALSTWLVSTPALAVTSKAAAFGWPVAGDTQVAFSSFFANPHTIAFRFMPQYPRGYEGPIVTSTATNSFRFGQGNYRASGSGVDGERLALTINGQQRTFMVPGLVAGVWAHIALVRLLPSGRSTTFRVYFNGALLSAVETSSTDFTFFTPVTTPAGFIRLGRTDPDQTGTDQSYGLVDDVAVFSTALTGFQIANIAQNVPQLTGNEANLLAGFTFDSPLPASGPLSGTVTWHNLPASPLVIVSTDRDSAADAPMLPLPNQFYAPNMKLPFKLGQAWTVVQPFGGLASHNGPAAFSLDFTLTGAETPNKILNPHSNGRSCGEPVFASQGGTFELDGTDGLPSARDIGGDPDDGIDFDYYNQTRIRQTSTARAVYLHLFTGSIRAAYPGVTLGAEGPLLGGMAVNQGRQIGAVGTGNGCHLHQSVNNGVSPQANYPWGYHNYEACDAHLGVDCTNESNWYHVTFGIPKEKQWVRNPL